MNRENLTIYVVELTVTVCLCPIIGVQQLRQAC